MSEHDLTTAERILFWAMHEYAHFPCDYETAAYLARAVRIAEAFDRINPADDMGEYDISNFDGINHYGHIDELRHAAKESTK